MARSGHSWLIATLFLVLTAAPASGRQDADELHVNAIEEFYELPDETLSGVVTRMNGARLEGPDGPRSQGLTRYSIRPEWRPGAGGGLCRVTDLQVRVEIVVTLPSWPGAERRPADERSGWATIEQAIREHEYTHRDVTIEAGGALVETLRAIETRGCGTLRQVVATAVSLANGRLTEAHANIDRETPKRLPIGR